MEVKPLPIASTFSVLMGGCLETFLSQHGCGVLRNAGLGGDAEGLDGSCTCACGFVPGSRRGEGRMLRNWLPKDRAPR